MSENIRITWKETGETRSSVAQCPSVSLVVKVCLTLSLLLHPGGGLRLSGVGNPSLLIENEESHNPPMNPIQRKEDDLELLQELEIFAPPVDQTQHISYLEEMQATMEKTTHVLSQETDDSWVPAVSALVIVLIVFSISVFACCLHCPFCCVYRMNDPHRIV